MGLGKTVQMIVFLAGLKYSKISARKKWVFSYSIVYRKAPLFWLAKNSEILLSTENSNLQRVEAVWTRLIEWWIMLFSG